MTQKPEHNKGPLPLTNVEIAMGACLSALDPMNEPGLHLFYGESGWGKTVGVTSVANEFRAVFVTAIEGMTKRSLLADLLVGLGEPNPRGSTPDMIKRASAQLLEQGKPVIIDEADKLTHEGRLEVVRAIHDASLAPIILVGEERLPEKLERFDRFHNRIIGFHPAQPASQRDAELLAGRYAHGVTIAPELIKETNTQCRGVTRRLRNNFQEMRRLAKNAGVAEIDLEWFQKHGRFLTGKKPERR